MTELETELRTWMQQRAARVHASPRLLATAYHPRARWVRPRAAIGGGLATAAAALTALMLLASGTSTAFAGWSPQPTTPTPAQVAATEDYCANNAPFAGLPLKLVDARGPFTIVIYSNGTSDDFCSNGPSFTNTSGWTTSPPVTVPAGRLFLWTDHVSTSGGQSYGSMIAQAASDVSGATVTLDDGSTVTATVQNGWVAAWWPGAHHVASAQLTTRSGPERQTFAPYPCDVHSCNGGGPHGAGPGGSPGGG